MFYPTYLYVEVGDVVSVFDGSLWNGKDSDKDDFFREATILKIYIYGDPVADVRFHHDGRISHGHFINMMKP